MLKWLFKHGILFILACSSDRIYKLFAKTRLNKESTRKKFGKPADYHRNTQWFSNCFARLKETKRNRLGTLYLYYCIPKNREKQDKHTHTHTNSLKSPLHTYKTYHCIKATNLSYLNHRRNLRLKFKKKENLFHGVEYRESNSFSNGHNLWSELNVQLLTEDAKHYKQNST